MNYNHLSRGVAFLIGVATIIALSVVVCLGQVSSSGINGTVTDSSGAVVPGARVTLQNVDTNVVRTTSTNQGGSYAFLRLPPGTYTIKVGKLGFKTASQERITLAVNQVLTYSITLSVGSETQTVTVQAAAAHVETSTTELGTTVNQRAVNSLPLNGRNFTQLLTLSPGVSPISVAQNSGGFMANPVGSFTFPSINGQNNRSNFFSLDGINNLRSCHEIRFPFYSA
jgi:Carboxypeptidase regulatory-like domain